MMRAFRLLIHSTKHLKTQWWKSKRSTKGGIVMILSILLLMAGARIWMSFDPWAILWAIPIIVVFMFSSIPTWLYLVLREDYNERRAEEMMGEVSQMN